MKIGKVISPVKVPKRVERKVQQPQPIPVKLPEKKEKNVPAQT